MIASLAVRAAASGLDVVIASSDKDFLQLVSPRIGMFNPNDKSEKVWSADDVVAKTGVPPGQIVDWLSLIGDSVDNIPGVRGVGAKTAAELLRQFGTVEALYERLDEVKSERLRTALKDSAEAVRRNQRIIRLPTDLPAPGLDEFKPRPADEESLRALYSEWGFRSLLAELEKAAPTQPEFF